MTQKVNKKKGKREIKRKEVRKPEKKRKPDNKKGQERKRSEVYCLKAIKHKKLLKGREKEKKKVQEYNKKCKYLYYNPTLSGNIIHNIIINQENFQRPDVDKGLRLIKLLNMYKNTAQPSN